MISKVLPSRPRRFRAFVALAVAVFLLAAYAGAMFLPGQPTRVADSTGSSVADECRAALGYPARSATDLAWLKSCVDALTPPTVGPTATPTGTTPPATTTPAATTTPVTTPPATSTPPATTTPTATVTTSPTGILTGCVAHPGACGYPDATTTGPTPGTVLTPSAITKVTVAGTVLSGLQLGCLVIAAPSVVIRDSTITCSANYVVDTFGSTASYLADHVTVVCTGTGGGTAFGENHFVVVAADISHCVNGGDADDVASITRSYIHAMTKASAAVPDPHTDGIQVWPGASSITFSGNTVLMAGDNSAFTSGFPAPTVAHLTIEGNLLDGGNYTVYCANNVGTLANNRFGPIYPGTSYPAGYTDSCANMTRTGNRSDVTGLLIPNNLLD